MSTQSALPASRDDARPDTGFASPHCLTVDSAWRVESIDPEAARLLTGGERPPGEFVGRDFWGCFPAFAGTAAEPRIRATMQQHAADDFELRYDSTGARLEIRIRQQSPALSLCFRDASGDGARLPDFSRPAGEFPAVSDLTRPRSPNLVCSFDREARLTHASAALLDRWGFRLSEAKGRTILQLNYPAGVAERLHRHIQRVIATGQPLREALSYAIRSARSEAHEHVFSPLLGDDGAVHGVAGAIRVLAENVEADGTQPPVPPVRDDVRRARILGEIATDFFAGEAARLPLNSLFDRITATLEADCCAYHRLVEGGTRLKLDYSHGLAPEQRARLAELALGEELPGVVAQHQLSRVIPELRASRTPETQTLLEFGFGSCACVPLKTADRLMGTLLLACRRTQGFEDPAPRFLESAAALIAARLVSDLPPPAPPPPQLQHADPPSAAQPEMVKETFLSAIAQELRAPLESTLLQVRTLAANPTVPSEVRNELEAIARNLTIEARLVGDLGDLARISRGELSIERQPLDLHSLVREAISTVKPDLAARGLILASSLPEVAPTIEGDAVRLQQVFWNLLKRAVRSTPRGGVVSVRLGLAPERIGCVTITDSGQGLSAQAAARVFEPWIDAQPGDAEESGDAFGFGMATVRKIVELHGGRVRVLHPHSGSGTSFVVELPLAAESSAPAESNSAEPRNPDARRPRADEPRLPCMTRILLVEDHPATREALLVLLRQRRYEVIVATSVREARGLAGQHRFDLVISAVTLPDGSGYELMAALRLDHGLSGIALVGNGTEKDAALGRTAGFVLRLSKPVSVDALERALAAQLSKR